MTEHPSGANGAPLDDPPSLSASDGDNRSGLQVSETTMQTDNNRDDPTTEDWLWNSFTPETTPEEQTEKSAAVDVDDSVGGEDSPQSEPTILSEECKQAIDSTQSFSESTLESHVLLRSPSEHAITNAVFERCLTSADPTGRNILYIVTADTLTQQRPVIQSLKNYTAGNTAVVTVGTDDPSMEIEQHVDLYKRISSPTKLAKLGVVVTYITSQWQSNSYPTVLGLHTISSFQNYVDTETLCDFLYTLRGQLESSHTTSYVHMDAFAHDDHEVDTIQGAFDLTLTISADGSVDIN